MAFPLKDRTTVLAQKQMQRITLFEFYTPPADLHYRLVPSRSRLAHLAAQVKNSQNFPLLHGRADIYRYSGFVGRSSIPYTPPGEEFTVGFGVERSIKVHREANHYQDKASMLGSGKKFITDIHTRIDFFADSSLPLVVWERLPVSQVEEVEVKLLPETSPGGHKSSRYKGFRKWTLNLSKGAGKKLRLRYQVTVPEDFSGKIFGD
jgi:uncharacterized protein (TIGR02231 family)